MARIAWLGSGKGSILKFVLSTKLYDVALVATDRDCPTIDVAKKRSIPYVNFYKSKNISDELLNVLKEYEIDYAMLTFKTILRGQILKDYDKKLINYHPAPLPEYKGLGAIKRAFENGTYGFTFHFVDSGIDTGDIIASVRHPVVCGSLESIGQSVYKKTLPVCIEVMDWMNERIKNESK